MAERKQELLDLLGEVSDEEGALALILTKLPDNSPLLKLRYKDRRALVWALTWERDELLRAAGPGGGAVAGAASSTGQAGAGAGVGMAAGVLELAKQFGSGHEGLRGRKYTTKRTQTVEALWQLVLQRGYIILRAPPESGKTSLLQLLGANAVSKSVEVVRINCSQLGTRFIDDVLRENAGGSLGELIHTKRAALLLMDEAQLLHDVTRFQSGQFWADLKHLESGPEGVLVRVVLARTHGAGRSHVSSLAEQHDADRCTPIGTDKADMNVTILPSSAGGISIQLSRSEMDELWSSWLGSVMQGVPVGPVIRNWVYSICAGQVGLVVFCLDFLSRELTNEAAAKDEHINNKNAMFKLTTANFFSQLETVRSFINFRAVEGDAEALRLLRQLLWVDSLHANQAGGKDAPLVIHLCARGQIVIGNDLRLRFTSPLHKAWFLRNFYASNSGTRAVTSLDDLLLRVLDHLDPDVLTHTLGVGTNGLPLERSWQMAFYQACMAVLPSGTVVSPDVGQAFGSEGYVDFYIPQPYCMAVEIIRDGRDITKHLERFTNPDMYQPLLECGAVQQWAVVDFRCPGLGPPRIRHPNLISVKFTDAFKRACVSRNGQLLQEVVLQGTCEASLRAALLSVPQRPSSS